MGKELYPEDVGTCCSQALECLQGHGPSSPSIGVPQGPAVEIQPGGVIRDRVLGFDWRGVWPGTQVSESDLTEALLPRATHGDKYPVCNSQ